MTRFWSWLSGECSSNLFKSSLFARQRSNVGCGLPKRKHLDPSGGRAGVTVRLGNTSKDGFDRCRKENTPERKNTLPEPLQADEPLLYPLIPTPQHPLRSAEDTEEEEEEEEEEDEDEEGPEGLDEEAAEMLRCSPHRMDRGCVRLQGGCALFPSKEGTT